MEDSTRSAPATGFQKFLLDPKSSVKTYLSEISDKDKHNWQQNGQNGGSSNQQGNWQQQPQQYGNNGQHGYASSNGHANVFPERPATAAGTRPYQGEHPQVPQVPQQFGGPPQTPSFPMHSPPISNAGFGAPPHAPTPVHPEHQLSPQFTQHPQQTPVQQHGQPFGGPSSASYPSESLYGQQPQHAQNQSVNSVTVTATEITTASQAGLAPPGHDTAITAAKKYHRMIVEFETVKAVYFAANIRKSS